MPFAKAQYEDYEHLLEDTDLDNIRKDGKQKTFVELRPTVYTWNKNTNTNPNFKNYYTTIESDFWAKPE